MPEVGGFDLTPPAPERNTDGPGTFGGELEPPRGGHGEARNFRYHRAQSAVPQSLFKAGKNRLLVATLKIDDAVGFQAGLRERRCEEIWPREAPEHLAARAGCYASREERSGGAVDSPVSASRNFMQCAAR